MYNLLGHMHLHAGSKPFKCPYCTSKFNLKGNLSRHMKVKHGMDVSPEGQGETCCTDCRVVTINWLHPEDAHRHPQPELLAATKACVVICAVSIQRPVVLSLGVVHYLSCSYNTVCQ